MALPTGFTAFVLSFYEDQRNQKLIQPWGYSKSGMHVTCMAQYIYTNYDSHDHQSKGVELENLAWVEQVFGVECQFELPHQHNLSLAARVTQKITFEQPDAVLRADAAVVRAHQIEDV